MPRWPGEGVVDIGFFSVGRDRFAKQCISDEIAGMEKRTGTDTEGRDGERGGPCLKQRVVETGERKREVGSSSGKKW